MPAMSGDQHAVDRPGHEDAVRHHLTDDHGEDHGHDDHAHGEESLGPIDVVAWLAGLLGVAIALLIVFGFVLATSYIG
jgi:ABC-type Zn2+ transport system substrate-binding protein/surface adhesin